MVLVAVHTAGNWPEVNQANCPAADAQGQQTGQNNIAHCIPGANQANPWYDSVDNWLSAIGTWAAVGISIAALIWLRETWRETQRTADAAFAAVAAAQEANAITSEIAQRQLRAYIGVDHIDPQRFQPGATPLFGIVLKNTDTTPAKRFRHSVFISAHSKDTVRKYRTEGDETRTSSSVDIGAGGSYVMIASADIVVSGDLFDAVGAV